MVHQIVGPPREEQFDYAFTLLYLPVDAVKSRPIKEIEQVIKFRIQGLSKTLEMGISVSCHRLTSFVVVVQVQRGNQTYV